MSRAVEIELTSGKTIVGNILAKALNVMIVHTKEGKFIMVSKYALKDPDKFKFKD